MAALPAFAAIVAGALQTTATSYGTYTGAMIAGGTFVVGHKYLILAHAQVAKSGGVGQVAIRLQKGAVSFAGGEMILTPNSNTARYPWTFFALWTATNDALTVQWRSTTGVAVDGRALSLIAIDLDALVDGTDYHYVEDNASLLLTTTPQNGATVTFQPGTASHRWLVLTRATLLADDATDRFGTQMQRSGQAASTTPDTEVAGRSASEVYLFCNARVFTLGATSNTFRERSYRVGTGGTTATRTRSAVLALDLDSLAVIANSYTDALVDLTSSYVSYNPITVNPTVTGEALVIMAHTYEPLDNDKFWKTRPQVDGAEIMAGWEAANLQQMTSMSAADRWQQVVPYLLNLSTGTRTLSLQALTPASGVGPGKGIRHRLMLAAPLELAGGPPPGGGGGQMISFRRRKGL